MNTNPVPLRPSRFLFISLGIAIAHSLVSSGYCGSIHFDGSLGSAGTLNGPNFLIPADRGKQVGGNLFHSFSDFNLIKDDVASFQGPSNVQNILARVTGGSRSNIDGTLRSEIAGANLYFLNPAGVMFGENAKLDISGSLSVVTASRLTLKDGVQFNSAPGPADTLLTSAPPTAFGLLNGSRGPIVLNGTHLETASEGKISLNGASVRMTKGASVFAGSVVIRGGKLTMDQARVSADEAAFDATGRMHVQLRGNLSMNSSTLGGSGGAVSAAAITLSRSNIYLSDLHRQNLLEIHANEMRVLKGSSIDVSSSVLGPVGTVRLDLSGNLIIDHGSISGGARVNVAAHDLLCTRGIIEAGGTFSFRGPHEGGDIHLDLAGDLELRNGGKISAYGIGANAGLVAIHATNVRIDGVYSGIDASAAGNEDYPANAGIIQVAASGKLELQNRAFIRANLSGSSRPGNVQITANSALISGSSEITAETKPSYLFGVESNEGNGGDLRLAVADDLRVTEGGRLSANTTGSGAAGNLFVSARDLFVSDGKITAANAGTGAGGAIDVNAKESVMLDHGRISATAAKARGGNIFLRTDDFFSFSSIITAFGATSGTIEIAARELHLEPSVVNLPGALFDAPTHLGEPLFRIRPGLP